MNLLKVVTLALSIDTARSELFFDNEPPIYTTDEYISQGFTQVELESRIANICQAVNQIKINNTDISRGLRLAKDHCNAIYQVHILETLQQFDRPPEKEITNRSTNETFVEIVNESSISFNQTSFVHTNDTVIDHLAGVPLCNF